MDDSPSRDDEQPFHVSSIERRQARRYYVSVPIEFEGGAGTTRDVSELGVCFETEQWLPKGELTGFRLVFRDVAGFPSWRIVGSGEVVRVEEYGGRFIVGVRVKTYGLG